MWGVGYGTQSTVFVFWAGCFLDNTPLLANGAPQSVGHCLPSIRAVDTLPTVELGWALSLEGN